MVSCTPAMQCAFYEATRQSWHACPEPCEHASTIVCSWCCLAWPQVDIKNRKHFLKRTRYEELRPELLFIGSKVTVFGRQIVLIEYGDEFTRSKMESKSEK